MSARLAGWIPGSGRFDRTVAPVTRLGATADNEVTLPVDGVSRQHARITEEADGYWIEDARSKNGTWVNGERATRTKLRHLDVITLGRFAEMVFLTGAAESPLTTALSLRIEWLNGPSAGTMVAIEQGETILGRADSCGLVVDDASISRAHARITHSGESVSIEDLGSVNGTTVNGVPVVDVVSLKSGDVVEVGGDRRFSVIVEGGGATAAAEMPGAAHRAPQDMEWMTRLVWSESDLEAVRAGLVAAGKKTGKSKSAETAASPASGSPIPAPPRPDEILVPPAADSAPPPAATADTRLGQPGLPPPPTEIAGAGDARTIIGELEPEPPPFAGAQGRGDGTKIDLPAAGAPPSRLPDLPSSKAGRAGMNRPDLPAETVLGYRDVAPGVPRGLGGSSASPAPDSQSGGLGRQAGGPLRGVRLSGNIGTFDLAVGTVATIGRSDQATVRIDSRDVSRVHAILTVGEREVTLEDRGSVNGTLLNGAPLLGTRPLADGDRVAIADFEFAIEFQGTEPNP